MQKKLQAFAVLLYQGVCVHFNVPSISALPSMLLSCEARFALGARSAHLPSLGSQPSGLWLHVIPSKSGHRIASAVFIYAPRASLGLPVPGGASLVTRRPWLLNGNTPSAHTG